MIKRLLILMALILAPLGVKADQMMGVGIHPDDFYVFDLNGRLLFVDDRPILTLIGQFEGPDGYDTFYNGSKIKPPKPLSQMSIREVQTWQDQSVAAGSRSSAAGVYQFIRKSLKATYEAAGISPDTMFDRFTQDRLARFALRRCGFYKHTETDNDIANCLAGTWAALPMVTGDKAGKSRYQGVAGNRSLTSVESVLNTVRGRFRDIVYAGDLMNYRPAPVQSMNQVAQGPDNVVLPKDDGIVFSVSAPTPQELAAQRAEQRKNSYERRRQNLRGFGGYVPVAEDAPKRSRPEIVIPLNKINP